MYKCMNCNAVFDKLQVYSRWQHEPDAEPPEWDGCPYCSSAFVIKLRQCVICGEYEDRGCEIKKTGDFICAHCLNEVDGDG